MHIRWVGNDALILSLTRTSLRVELEAIVSVPIVYTYVYSQIVRVHNNSNNNNNNNNNDDDDDDDHTIIHGFSVCLFVCSRTPPTVRIRSTPNSPDVLTITWEVY